jgi:branched-chain amino acid transport system substrate-binding protein
MRLGRRWLAPLAVLAAGTLTLAACGAQQSAGEQAKAPPGVTGNQITIGGTMPMSGSASVYYSVGKGANAYFQYVNSQGGVNGRQIKYNILDDAYTPSQTPAKARQLVEQDKVFLTFSDLGTPPNIAVRDYYNAQKVPQLFVATGADTWGTDYKKYPWTLGWQPSYVTEGKIYAKHILQDEPNDKIGVLYQNDDYGQDYLHGLQQGLGSKASSMIVAQTTYNANDPVDMSSQVNRLKASGADTFYVAATPNYAANAGVNAVKSGWKPRIYMNNVAGATSTWRAVVQQLGSSAGIDGMVSTVYVKDPLDTARYGNDKGVQLFRDVMTKYGNGCDPSGADAYCVTGFAAAYTMADVLRKAGKDLTRQKVMDLAASNLNETDNPMLVPGTVVRTTKNDHHPIQQEQLQRWAGDHWAPFGQVIGVRSPTG